MPDQSQNNPVLEIRNLSKKFIKPLDLAGKIAQKLGQNIREEVVHAVDDVSITVNKGEVVSLVGESGCGKSTLGRMVAGILPPTAGEILYKGVNVADQSGADARETALKIQMIFQDPFASLNPRLRVQEILGEAPLYHKLVDKAGFDAYLDQIMTRCGLDPDYKRRYPHQFSGGQRQRIGIARALAVQPDFIVCDEAVAALDVSIQAQILKNAPDAREGFFAVPKVVE